MIRYAIAIVVGCFAPLATAQQPFPYSPGPRITIKGTFLIGYSAGIRVAAPIGDVDGDGGIDLAAAGSHESGVYRGLDGKSLHIETTGLSHSYGYSIARRGDVDGDGIEDYAVSDPSFFPGGKVFTRSGSTGLELQSLAASAFGWNFGNQLATVGDVDLDGSPDLLVGAATAELPFYHQGAAFLYSGASGALLRSWTGTEENDLFGEAVDGAGDVDQDGVPDVILGGQHAGPGDLGEVRVCSGLTGQTLIAHTAQTLGDYFAIAALGIGDFNGDGLPDHAVGTMTTKVGSFTGAGMVRVYSGLDATPFLTFSGSATNEYVGLDLGGGGDLDGDQRSDFLIVSATSQGFGSGKVLALGSTTQAVIHASQSVFTNQSYAGGVILGDLDQDGVMEYGAADTGFTSGLIAVTSVCGGYAATKGAGCPGLGGYVPRLRLAGCPVPGASVSMLLENARGGVPGVLLFGTVFEYSASPWVLPGGCVAHVKTYLPLNIAFTTTGTGAGQGTLTLSGTLTAGTLPVPVAVQAFIADAAAPFGYTATNGLYLDN